MISNPTSTNPFPTRARTCRCWRWLLAAGVLLAPPVRGDEITTASEHLRKIKITDYVLGRIRFCRPAGEPGDVAVFQVRTLLIDSIGDVGDLNQAEIYIDQGETAQAVLRYERALRGVQGFWQDLARVRLLQACNRAGMPDKAVAQWLEVLKQDPACAAELLPDHLPPTRTHAVDRALSDLDAAATKTNDETARRLVDVARYAIHCRLGDNEAGDLAERVAAQSLTGPAATAPAYAVKTDALRSVFQRRGAEAALAGLDPALTDAPETALPDLLLLKGDILFATARERTDYVRAGWAYLRVPIHFPHDPRAARGLWGAARVHEKLEAPELAVQLLRECLAVEGIDAATRTSAAEALQRLTARSGG
jgi:hypothetical protein